MSKLGWLSGIAEVPGLKPAIFNRENARLKPCSFAVMQLTAGLEVAMEFMGLTERHSLRLTRHDEHWLKLGRGGDALPYTDRSQGTIFRILLQVVQ
jgi:hypothetical protein